MLQSTASQVTCSTLYTQTVAGRDGWRGQALGGELEVWWDVPFWEPNETKLGELIPRDALRQLVALLEECRRRALARDRFPKEIRITLELDERTGEVVEVPRRYGRERG